MDEQHIVDVNALEQYTNDMKRYGVYILTSRALAEYRDGFKPVTRRIVYAIGFDLKATPNHTVKSAKIAGTVVGTYNPHGDVACYDAMRPLVNWFGTSIIKDSSRLVSELYRNRFRTRLSSG